MAIHLIIDGYNLIRQSPRLSAIEAGDLEDGRQALLELLARYRQSRSRHKVTVVFDGWLGGGLREGRDLQQGIQVIYSRRGERADEVIKRLAAREGSRAVVVSSDRELQETAEQAGGAWIAALEFERLHLDGPGHGGAEDTEEDGSAASGRLEKKGPSRRLPKRQRQRQQRLRKL